MTERANPLDPLYALCNQGNSAEKYAGLPAFPRLVDLELTNTCNFRCLMCPTGNFSQRREKGLMSEEVFYRVLDQLAPTRTPIRFIRWGEPLLHPKVVDFIEACSRAGIVSHMNTNGSKLTEELAGQLIDAGLKSLKFSFQGVDRKSYEEMRNTDFFDGLLETIEMLARVRGDRAFPYLHISTTITYETPAQVEAFTKRVTGLVEKVSVGRTILDLVDLNAVRLKPHEVERLRWLKEHESLVKNHPECPEIFDKLSINWDGSVSACCNDPDNLMLVGDTATQTLAEIWSDRVITKYREMLVDMRHDELPVCKDCWDYMDLFATPEAGSKPAQKEES
ncbi:putative cofactor modifying protein [Paramagnetospirillum caucaseum]|uniref:Putative cofactor modifying protein n=1 Tax=Paramagnetospirillum caucaseum TaxID=1244869 RepID=M2ZPS7_9PROT|nr:radical SAM protein [Paramagnetospirillum caucaseum]EME69307.1 putative cofactor modifying protein [Paramagnetospirillum caucaseum]